MKKILIIDEDPGICYSMHLFLQNRYDVVTCTSVEEGINNIKSEGADLLITEARISREGASKMIRKVRKLEHDLPIVLMSVCEDEMHAVEKDTGIKLNGYILKPFENDEVVNTLESIFATRDKTRNSTLASSL